jgi:hypothetical protein
MAFNPANALGSLKTSLREGLPIQYACRINGPAEQLYHSSFYYRIVLKQQLGLFIGIEKPECPAR